MIPVFDSKSAALAPGTTLPTEPRNGDLMSKLTDHEFEDVYRESLGCLASAGHDVGEPHDGDGLRHCVVDGKTLDDRGVIETWGDAEIARKIFEGR